MKMFNKSSLIQYPEQIKNYKSSKGQVIDGWGDGSVGKGICGASLTTHAKAERTKSIKLSSELHAYA